MCFYFMIAHKRWMCKQFHSAPVSCTPQLFTGLGLERFPMQLFDIQKLYQASLSSIYKMDLVFC